MEKMKKNKTGVYVSMTYFHSTKSYQFFEGTLDQTVENVRDSQSTQMFHRDPETGYRI